MTSAADSNSPDPPPAAGDRHRSSLLAGLVFLVAAIVVGMMFLNLGGEGDTGTGDPAAGHRLPFLNLQPLTGGGKPVALDDLAGHVTVIDFWGTWCPVCIDELPHLATLAAEYRGRPDFQLLAVSCGIDNRAEDFAKIREQTQSFLHDYKLEMPTYFDPESVTRRKLDMAVGFKGYPTTLVVDRHGMIRGIWSGYQAGDERQIAKLVAELLSDKK